MQVKILFGKYDDLDELVPLAIAPVESEPASVEYEFKPAYWNLTESHVYEKVFDLDVDL